MFFQSLEDEFAYQLEEQERYYGPCLKSALGATSIEGSADVTNVGGVEGAIGGRRNSNISSAASSSSPSKRSSPSKKSSSGLVDRKSSSKSSGSDRSAS